MKRIVPFIAIATLTLFIYSCKKEEPLQLNSDFLPTIDDADTSDTGGGPMPLPTLTDTFAQNRTAVLEYFTGNSCYLCPYGAFEALTLDQQFDSNLIPIAVHGDTIAEPTVINVNTIPPITLQLVDFRTQFADELFSQAAIESLPAGTINRMSASDLGVTGQTNSVYSISFGDWASAITSVNAQSSPVNIGAEARVDSGNVLTVKVELYYTDEESQNNYINVALIQDEISSNQLVLNLNTSPARLEIDTSYDQSYLLRHYLTGQWGDVSSLRGTKSKGTLVKKTYTYSIPNEFHASSNAVKSEGVPVIENMRVVAFVSRERTEILNAVEVDIIR